MKTAIVFAAVCVVLAIAGPVHQKSDKPEENQPQIVAYQNDNSGVGPYNFAFETSDGQKREEHAQVVIENDEPTQIVSGSYSYFGDDGQLYTINYTADKDGFHPTGSHLPVAPPVPEQIARALNALVH